MVTSYQEGETVPPGLDDGLLGDERFVNQHRADIHIIAQRRARHAKQAQGEIQVSARSSGVDQDQGERDQDQASVRCPKQGKNQHCQDDQRRQGCDDVVIPLLPLPENPGVSSQVSQADPVSHLVAQQAIGKTVHQFVQDQRDEDRGDHDHDVDRFEGEQENFTFGIPLHDQGDDKQGRRQQDQDRN